MVCPGALRYWEASPRFWLPFSVLINIPFVYVASSLCCPILGLKNVPTATRQWQSRLLSALHRGIWNSSVCVHIPAPPLTSLWPYTARLTPASVSPAVKNGEENSPLLGDGPED